MPTYYTLHRGLNTSDLFTSASTQLDAGDIQTLSKCVCTIEEADLIDELMRVLF